MYGIFTYIYHKSPPNVGKPCMEGMGNVSEGSFNFSKWMNQNGKVNPTWCIQVGSTPHPVTVDKQYFHFYEGATTTLQFTLLQGGGFTQYVTRWWF